MDAVGQIAALHVADLGEALARLCLGSSTELRLDESREFDLGGPDLFLFRDYIRALRTAQSPRSAMCVPVPGLFARLFAHACDLVHFSPFSFGHWELLRRDNKPQVNRLAELLRRNP
jgi:NADH dehydrogenase